ncbi:MAG: polymerase subunit delta [Frankiaceae bacterium]|jgi:DNA polymerase-3 subunit delta'|nr:polymerase subunit delta [Frankiaceae bacterium]MDX6275452.1 polymerase subunit delta [Frankiales bacterium]
MSVFSDLVGQEAAVEVLSHAARTPAAMTHAWLFTGPPGSGRSVAARAFAAALQCPDGGCGDCEACHTVLAGSHPDVEVVAPEGLSYSVREMRQLVVDAAMAPLRRRYRIVIIEDADRFTEQASNAFLKTLEEPPPRAVLLLCAPTLESEDVSPTIRSRCRHVALRTPPTAAVAEVLVRRDGVDPAMAAFAARIAQGHIGRARRLARDEDARRRRREVLALPQQVGTVPGALTAAENLISAAKEESLALTAELEARELADLRAALGATEGKPAPRGTAGAFSDLEKRQKSRATRTERDALDRALTDLAGFYRDVLVMQSGGGAEIVNADLAEQVAAVARATTAEATVRRIDAVLACREQVGLNVNTLLATEAMALALRAG